MNSKRSKEAVDFIRDEWIPALRSGNYKQGCLVLRDHDDKFCCLGVACDLLEVRLNLKVSSRDDYITYDNQLSLLPQTVSDFLSMSRDGAYFNEERDRESLAGDNDRGMSFDQITDILFEYFCEVEDES